MLSLALHLWHFVGGTEHGALVRPRALMTDRWCGLKTRGPLGSVGDSKGRRSIGGFSVSFEEFVSPKGAKYSSPGQRPGFPPKR